MKISGRGLECELQFSEPDSERWMRAFVGIKAPGFEGGFRFAVEKEEWNAFTQARNVDWERYRGFMGKYGGKY